jgi:hypothetical protein
MRGRLIHFERFVLPVERSVVISHFVRPKEAIWNATPLSHAGSLPQPSPPPLSAIGGETNSSLEASIAIVIFPLAVAGPTSPGLRRNPLPPSLFSSIYAHHLEGALDHGPLKNGRRAGVL